MKLPISLWVEVESGCNLACRFCYNPWRGGSEATPRALATGALIAGLDAICDRFECRQVAISGGEPLLRRDLGEIIRFLKGRGVRVVLTTNGTLLTAEIVEQLVDWNVDTVQVSLHSSLASEQDWLSGGQSFHTAVHALMLLRERGINSAAVFVATHRNLSRFPDLLNFLNRIDVRTVIFNRFIVSGLGVLHQRALGVPDDSSVLSVLERAETIVRATGQTIVVGTPIAVDSTTRQRLASIRFGSCPVRQRQYRWTIGADGEIRRCSHSLVSIGNLLDSGVSDLARAMTEEEVLLREPACGECRLNSRYFSVRRERQLAVES